MTTTSDSASAASSGMVLAVVVQGPDSSFAADCTEIKLHQIDDDDEKKKTDVAASGAKRSSGAAALGPPRTEHKSKRFCNQEEVDEHAEEMRLSARHLCNGTKQVLHTQAHAQAQAAAEWKGAAAASRRIRLTNLKLRAQGRDVQSWLGRCCAWAADTQAKENAKAAMLPDAARSAAHVVSAHLSALRVYKSSRSCEAYITAPTLLVHNKVLECMRVLAQTSVIRPARCALTKAAQEAPVTASSEDGVVANIGEKEEKEEKKKNEQVTVGVFDEPNTRDSDGDQSLEEAKSGAGNVNSKKKSKRKDARCSEQDDLPPLERLANQATPLWRLSYEEQLLVKKERVASALEKCWAQCKFPAEYASTQLPKLDHVLESPRQRGYRNKYEFTIGRDLNGDPCVGMNIGKFNESLAVCSPRGLFNTNDISCDFAEITQEFVKRSGKPVWDRRIHSGFFRLLVVRTPESGEAMVTLQINEQHPSYTSENKITNVLSEFEQEFRDFFLQEAEKRGCRVDVLGVQYYTGMADVFQNDDSVRYVFTSHGHLQEQEQGDLAPRVTEVLENNKVFEISAGSFFQVNTGAANVLYSCVRDWIRRSCADTDVPNKRRRVLLDLCCGTGTIGIIASDCADEIIGVELVASAVRDAERNALRNKVTNARYIHAPVETVLAQFLPSAEELEEQDTEYIAVLDPPRCGVHKSVTRAIRACRAISRVIYVSCDIEPASRNLVELCRAPAHSAAAEDVPFAPSRVSAVDMFPFSNPIETVVELVRQRQ